MEEWTHVETIFLLFVSLFNGTYTLFKTHNGKRMQFLNNLVVGNIYSSNLISNKFIDTESKSLDKLEYLFCIDNHVPQFYLYNCIV